jgi:exonuclease SbcD
MSGMRILHTADWHLNDRLGRIDRTEDLRAAVERVAGYCREQSVDVLLVAGDLFSELARPDALRETIHHWQDVFAEFLGRGGTILTLTGNHDNENFCRTLRHAMTLAAPTVERTGEVVPPGRLYLAADPTLLRLRDPAGFDVQFVLMPYPTPTRYLTGEAGQRYSSPEEKNRLLVAAFDRALQDFRRHPTFDENRPSVLAAHANVYGSDAGVSLFRMHVLEDVLVRGEQLPDQFDYVALGHIHKPGTLGGHPHVRYSGSIERMDLGEQADAKGVVVFDLGPDGLIGEPAVLPLPATSIYEVSVLNPAEDLPRLRAEYADADRDLVNLHIRYTAGTDNLEEVLRELESIFPRWYARDWHETGALGPTLVADDPDHTRTLAETVRDYLRQELATHDEAERDAILALADELIRECDR